MQVGWSDRLPVRDCESFRSALMAGLNDDRSRDVERTRLNLYHMSSRGQRMEQRDPAVTHGQALGTLGK